MFVQNPNHRGAVAEAAITYAAVQLGVSVFKPISEHGRCDFVFEIRGRLFRVQCKSASRRGEAICIGLESSWRTATRSVRAPYLEAEVDVVAAHCHELGRNYLLPIDLIAGQRAAAGQEIAITRYGRSFARLGPSAPILGER